MFGQVEKKEFIKMTMHHFGTHFRHRFVKLKYSDHNNIETRILEFQHHRWLFSQKRMPINALEDSFAVYDSPIQS